MLTDLLEVHFVELQKLQAQAVGLERRLVRWMLFLTTKTREQLEELAMQEPALKKALTTLEFLSQDERIRQLYEERHKGLMTYTADVESAREEGREEGEHHRAATTARKMLLAGMDVRQIAEFVDLSVDAVEAIRRSLN